MHEGLRLFVAGVDDPDGGLPPVVMINPEIEPLGLAEEEDWEGCLSIPDIRGPRAACGGHPRAGASIATARRRA